MFTLWVCPKIWHLYGNLKRPCNPFPVYSSFKFPVRAAILSENRIVKMVIVEGPLKMHNSLSVQRINCPCTRPSEILYHKQRIPCSVGVDKPVSHALSYLFSRLIQFSDNSQLITRWANIVIAILLFSCKLPAKRVLINYQDKLWQWYLINIL